jgi:hypothetical protein
MNFLFISPNFPNAYSKFAPALKNIGFCVLGIGDVPFSELNDELKNNLTEYYTVSNLDNIRDMISAIDYLQDKYGHIDYLESNNEYWLANDAVLREWFNILSGQWPAEMGKIKRKSEMKKYFENAGVKVARHILIDTLENSQKFISEVGYPVFIKPNIGVGSTNSHAINNEKELLEFHKKSLNMPYIMEEYIDGDLISFDGIADSNSDVVLAINEHFPILIADIVNNNLDVYYFAKTEMNKEFEKLGRSVVKSFGIKKRCFHIEFFKLRVDRPGLAKRGEIIGLEVNMRPPGGNTLNLLSIALNHSFYDYYAEVMMLDKLKTPFAKNKIVAICAARKNIYNYKFNNGEILSKYGNSIVEQGRYPKSIALAMGDIYYYARFENLPEAIQFADDICQKINPNR